MENENEVNLETPNEEVQETIETPVTETTEETLETPAVDVDQLQATNKKLFERAKKAEADLKALKGQKPATAPAPQLGVEETVLLANGMSEELIEELKLRAPQYGGSLIKAQKDSRFIAVKEQFEREKKQREASLPASRGAGSVKQKKTLLTPGLSREEHMKLVQESQ